jgi:hypothetical protein
MGDLRFSKSILIKYSKSSPFSNGELFICFKCQNDHVKSGIKNHFFMNSYAGFQPLFLLNISN